jgi:hypothetical protein
VTRPKARIRPHPNERTEIRSTGSAARLMTWFRRGEVRLVAGSILDADLVNRELAGAGTVFHLAAAVGVGRIVADPLGSRSPITIAWWGEQ